MPNTFLKVFCIQRSGSNWLYSLFVNFNIQPTFNKTTGWKHSFIDVKEHFGEPIPEAKVIVLIKNPYTWYPSIRRWISAVPSDFPFGEHTVENIYKRYNALYQNYMDFLDGRMTNIIFSDGILVRYEDLLMDTKGELQRIADRFCIELKPDIINQTKVEQSKQFTEIQKDYYLRQMPDYDDETIQRVNNAVDWELMKYYGYSKRSD